MFSFMIHNAPTTLAAAIAFLIFSDQNYADPVSTSSASPVILKVLKATKDTISL
jgi:hypothetical protein